MPAKGSRRSLLDRLDQFSVPEPNTGCLLWTGSGRRYPKMIVDGRSVGAHVVSLQVQSGQPSNGRSAIHVCDTPKCINPRHLRWASAADNSKDMVLKNRSDRGTSRHSAKLSEVEVLEIRLARQNGEKAADLAKKYGVAPAHISGICNGRKWGWLQ